MPFPLTAPVSGRAPPPLTAEQHRALARIANRATCYEAVVIRADGERRLLAYCDRRSNAGLLGAMRQRGAALLDFLECGDDATFKAIKGGGYRLGDCRVVWSGRTQRDAIMEGSLTYIDEAGRAARRSAA